MTRNDKIAAPMALLLLAGCGGGVTKDAQPALTSASVPTRITVGPAGAYKPALVVLPNGDTLLVAFIQPAGTAQDNTLMYRSRDGGATWAVEPGAPAMGREFYFSLLTDGTLLMTGGVEAGDPRNTRGYYYSVLERSVDNGHTWVQTVLDSTIGPAPIVTSRNVLERPDGTLLLGVGAGTAINQMWRSNDDGLTWTASTVTLAEFDEAANGIPWTEELVLTQAPNGDVVGIARVYTAAAPGNDDETHMLRIRSTDAGATWTAEDTIGTAGEMYPAVLPLGGGKVLFTYTLRWSAAPAQLGVRAVIGTAQPDGFEADPNANVIMLDTNTPISQPSGGGFGNTVQEPGGLLTAYSYRGADGNTHVEVLQWTQGNP